LKGSSSGRFAEPLPESSSISVVLSPYGKVIIAGIGIGAIGGTRNPYPVISPWDLGRKNRPVV
jgi:hypothetical protein